MEANLEFKIVIKDDKVSTKLDIKETSDLDILLLGDILRVYKGAKDNVEKKINTFFGKTGEISSTVQENGNDDANQPDMTEEQE